MPIPHEILAVARPSNTVVIAYGKGKCLYGVRQRIGCRYIDGRHLPVNGPTIGHILMGRYVPLEAEAMPSVAQSPVDLKDWADIALSDSVFCSILIDLECIYAKDDAMKIYCIAVLRVCSAGIKDYELEDGYETSFLSEIHPGVALSRNTVSSFLNNLGRNCSRIAVFMKRRADAVGMDDHVLVDGTLKSNESKVNSLSDFSRKAATKGTRDISLLYAFDLEKMEPICSKCFPGNMLDQTSYEAFISENGIVRGVIVADKGFPEKAADEYFAKHPSLHFLNPIKRNSKLIASLKLQEFTSMLPGYDGVTCKKVWCEEQRRWLYAFRDSRRASKEEHDWLLHARKHDTYDFAVFSARQREFGTVVLESDLDLAPEVIFKMYERRWEIEIVMRYYKSACEFDETRVQDDYSVIGSEFCDFLATVLTFRLIHAFDKAGVLETMNYGKAMSILKRAKKARLPGQDWKLLRINPSHERVLQSLGLLPQPEAVPMRKRGRPRKQHV